MNGNPISSKTKMKVFAKNMLTKEDARLIAMSTNVFLESSKDYIAITKEILKVVSSSLLPDDDTDVPTKIIIKDLGITLVNKKGRQIMIFNRLKDDVLSR